jgi:hypothetical protein
MYPQSLHLYRTGVAADFFVPAFTALFFTVFFGWAFATALTGVFFLAAAATFVPAGLLVTPGFFCATGDTLALAATGFFMLFALLFFVAITAFAIKIHHSGLLFSR